MVMEFKDQFHKELNIISPQLKLCENHYIFSHDTANPIEWDMDSTLI